jgi:translation initiation factor 3 subunit K
LIGIVIVHVQLWTDEYGWKVGQDGLVSLASQEEIIKTRNITEKIDLESVASIMASCY